MNLAEIFCDHMVLQRDKKICIFGYGKGEAVIEFCGQRYDFCSKDDKFTFYLPPQKAGGPYDMKVVLNGEVTLIRDILIGDVYIAAGQSNIEFTLKETVDIERFENQNIRFFTESNNADEEGNLIKGNAFWFESGSAKDADFSAIGYYFANVLQPFSNVPLGIISCSKGASRVDAWTSPEYVNTAEYQKMQTAKHNDYFVYKFNHNSWAYKNKLSNIIPFANSGVLWYQGESNRRHEEAVYYSKLLEIMIENWRKEWQDDLPFYLVQLMPYNESANVADWAMIRSEQEKAAKVIPNVYMVTLVNTGEAHEIHPKNKKTVAYSLANAVKNIQFGENVEYSGPILSGCKKIPQGLELEFSHAKGLTLKGDRLLDLQLINNENALIPFKAVIENDRLKLFYNTAEVVSKITLGYCNAPEHNLYNASGYLASPFCIENPFS